jgi:hypothetical protein
VIAALLAVLLLAGACSDGDETLSESTSSSTEPAAPDESTATEPRLVTRPAPDGPGPAEYDEIRVLQHGAEDAANVLVLVPGTSAGAAYFSPLATDIIEREPDWQVWAVDRRENLLEDHSRLDQYLAGDLTAQATFDYYLGWIDDPSITERFQPPTDDEVSFARDWGMQVAVDDLAVVIDEAKAFGGDVVLGGHSLGGTISVAYATWDFDGRPGADDLAGLVLIDGGSGPDSAQTPEEVQTQLDELAAGAPFNDLVGLGLPWAAGVFNALGSSAVLLEPHEPSIAYDWPLFPAMLRPPAPPTNAGLYGYALDLDTSPESLALVHLNLGHVDDTTEPLGWVDDELVPLDRAATMFSGVEGIDGTAWYHPLRLTIDGRTVNGGIANPAQDLVGVRTIHGDQLDFPIFALETSFGAGRVLNVARGLAARSGIDDDELTLVEAHELTHTDPMGAEPAQNPLLEALVPYLGGLG